MNKHELINSSLIDGFKPLFVFLGAISLADINTVISTIGGGASAIYAILKIVEFYKQNNKNKK